MYRLMAWLLACTIPLTLGASVGAADPPASPQQAAEVIDLSRFELVRPLEPDGVFSRRIAGQSYIAVGTVTEIAGVLGQRLKQAGWSPLGGGVITDQYASETYQKSGFTLSMSVSPSGKSNEVRVFMINHGNVDFKQLPLPGELTSQFQNAVMALFASPWTVDETTEKLSQALTGDGWTPYGAPAGSRQFKQNGVRLNVSIMAAPAQENRTVVQVSSEQMSADVPVPEGAEIVQYSDSTRSVSFDHAASLTEVFASVRIMLENRGWVATTEAPIKIDFRDVLIFRNPQQDMMEVMCHEFDGKTRTRIDFSTAEDVDAIDRALAVEVARRQAEMEKQSVRERIVIPKPAGSKITEAEGSRIEFSLATGKARSSLETWMRGLEKQGWKRTTVAQEKMAGNIILNKGEVELDITYVDPGFVPATVYLSVTGKADLQVKD